MVLACVRFWLFLPVFASLFGVTHELSCTCTMFTATLLSIRGCQSAIFTFLFVCFCELMAVISLYLCMLGSSTYRFMFFAH